jgi:hypothetical protein
MNHFKEEHNMFSVQFKNIVPFSNRVNLWVINLDKGVKSLYD